MYDDELELIQMFVIGCGIFFAFGISRPSELAMRLFGLAFCFVSAGLFVWWIRSRVPAALHKVPALLFGIIVGAGLFDRLVHG